MSAHVLALTLDLHLPACRSLKEKRSVVTPILDGARHRYRVAASETGHQDVSGRAELCFGCVSPSASHAVDVIDEVERFAWTRPDLEVVSAERAWVEQA